MFRIKEWDPNNQAYFYVDTQQIPAFVTWDDPRFNPLFNNYIPTTTSYQNYQPHSKLNKDDNNLVSYDNENKNKGNWFEDSVKNTTSLSNHSSSLTATSLKSTALSTLGILSLTSILYNNNNQNQHQSNKDHILHSGWGSGLAN